MEKVAVFIMSCDKTVDIAEYFIKSFESYWPNCPFEVYIGSNTGLVNGKSINAQNINSNKRGWKNETLDQLNQIKLINPDITHLLVFLDDFILRKTVDTNFTLPILTGAAAHNLSYLRCKPLEESFIGRIAQQFKKKLILGKMPCFEIRKDHPYYSALQVALWKYDHLQSSIELSADIWDFENKSLPNVTHYSVLNPIFNYKHIVEKGEWDYMAKKVCEQALGYFNPGTRKQRKKTVAKLFKSRLREMSFNIWGYSVMRIRKAITR